MSEKDEWKVTLTPTTFGWAWKVNHMIMRYEGWAFTQRGAERRARRYARKWMARSLPETVGRTFIMRPDGAE